MKKTVLIETGGSLPINKIPKKTHIILDLKCPSSNMEDKNLWDNIKYLKSKDEVKFVKRMEERILDIFTSRSELTRNKIKRNWERKDWWISADEAVEAKLVDEVRAILPEHSSNKKKKKK